MRAFAAWHCMALSVASGLITTVTASGKDDHHADIEPEMVVKLIYPALMDARSGCQSLESVSHMCCTKIRAQQDAWHAFLLLFTGELARVHMAPLVELRHSMSLPLVLALFTSVPGVNLSSHHVF